MGGAEGKTCLAEGITGAESELGRYLCQSQCGWSRAGKRMNVGSDEVGELSEIPSHRGS